ncbi:MAG: hypothetical protein FWE08_06060 [Oscillospiraceae bacterium]|nr:hypothetical protein [Oscillospiraceae bacterium]
MQKRPKSWIITIALIFLAIVAVIIVGYIAAEPPLVEHPGIEFLGEGVEAVVPTSPVRTEMPEIIIRTFMPDLPCDGEYTPLGDEERK